MGLTFKESQDLLHWSEATEALEAGESDGHLRLVVVVWIVLWKLSVETSSQLLIKPCRYIRKRVTEEDRESEPNTASGKQQACQSFI